MSVETKERTALAWPSDEAAEPQAETDHASDDRRLQEARAALAAEWQVANPQTPQEISRFYQQAQGIGDDLKAWHALPERQEWTRMLVHVAQQAHAQHIVDIGCGAGHDLRALEDLVLDAAGSIELARHGNTPFLQGVEPNDALREALPQHICVAADVTDAWIEDADLLICIDVLEHVPDPEAFLGSIAQRAPIGCLLFETTATHDTGTPLHLVENRGWHPGRVLERHGWELADHTSGGRVRVWRRAQEAGGQRASLLLCAYRSVSLGTLQSLLDLCTGTPSGNRWRLKLKGGDALIARSRAILLTAWWRETADDVALFVDDDVVFSAGDADRLSELCRNGHDVICGAYPVHDGSHLACRFLPGTGEVSFGPGQPPLEIMAAATGFMAVHRRVVDHVIERGDMPLCHADQPWSFYPLFAPRIALTEDGERHEWLSEDWAFSDLARSAGFAVWLDPQTRLEHRGEAPISLQNMAAMKAAIAQV